jgi:hypothetical protein
VGFSFESQEMVIAPPSVVDFELVSTKKVGTAIFRVFPFFPS